MDNYKERCKELEFLIKNLYPTMSDYQKEKVEGIFPELHESEDVRIIRTLKEIVNWGCAKNISVENNVELKDCLAWLEKQSTPQVRTGLEWVNTIDDACDKRYSEEYAHGEYCHEQSFKWGFQEGVDWLEKQGEQKPTDKIEPKFRVSDWITTVNGAEIEKVVEFTGNKVRLIDTDGVYMSCPQSWLNYYHLWTIKDVKDGDVLASNRSIFIFSQEYMAGKPKAHCGIMNGLFITKPEGCWTNEKCYPATKEQRGLLFQKMKEAGYEWDADKKELKKIERKPDFCHHKVDLSNCSEEYRKAYYDGWNNCNQQHEQLKAEQKSSWSEEDEDAVDIAIRIIQNGGDDCAGILDSDKALKWINSIKDRVKPQLKQEWSDEDEVWIDRACMLLDELNHLETLTLAKIPHNVNDIINHIKSLKPQQHWKPHEKQLEALRVASEVGTANNSWAMSVLKELLKELKLLKDYD